MNYYITLHDLTKYGRGKLAKLYIGSPPRSPGGYHQYDALPPKMVVSYLFKYSAEGYEWEFYKQGKIEKN